MRCSRDAEEFRRVAVRRKVSGAALQTVSRGVRGSYSCGRACDGVCGPNSTAAADEEGERSPGLRSQVSPKPAQSPLSASAAAGTLPQGAEGTEQHQSPERCCVSAGHTPVCSSSPVRGGVNTPVDEVTLSPVKRPRGVPTLVTSPVFGSTSPRKRSNRSPLKEGGHSPARLSPRSQSPLAEKLRTPSPVHLRVGSYRSVRNSKSWLGFQRTPSPKMEGQDVRTMMSLSVPDLVVYLDESRVPAEKVETSPLKLLPPANGSEAANCSLHRSSSETTVTFDDTEVSSDKIRDSESEDGKNERLDESGEREEPREEETTEQRLHQIASELLQTERAYVARLHLLDQVFFARLTEEAGRGSFPPEVIKNIFSNISSIYSFHSQFLLPDLESCLRHWCDRPGLGGVLLQHGPFLRMYADYVRNFDQAVELVRVWNERSSVFRNITQDIQSQEVCGSLTLQHHMLEPVQRIPRYELLLKDYLKKLPRDNPDYELAHKSLQTVAMAATHSNSAIQKAGSLKRVLEIYEMVGEEDVVNPANELIREGRLFKLAARNTSSMERYVFLFNNFLLCCTPKFSLVGQRFTVRCRIGVDGMQVQQTTNEDHPYSFQVSGKERTLELQASSEQDRDEWIKEIQESIDVFLKKNESFRLASKEMEELGRRAPRWIRDHEVSVCMKCTEPFKALTRRRHHCRACGCVVCWRCSDNKVALEYDGNRLNKVCKSCYSILSARRGGRTEGRGRTPEAEASSQLMRSFLFYGDNPKTWKQVWCVIGTEPPTLQLYAAQQDVEPLSCVPLLGCEVDDSCQELQGLQHFCLNQSTTRHSFCCDSVDLKQSWLAVLRDAAAGKMTANTLGSCANPTCEANRDGGQPCVSTGDEGVLI
ncbi:FYVE, RhoGEF and PH domain-containing protein 4 [Takifugu flavidus]|uniref:FYVE, RhoGEF and PH domain-containing protein 4 n=3 Tax=Takifugu flavidus TaxID=433684 RepID=A0A5C6NBJ4_9TELE|nr:FYVE, RhoGEF and PH domain-containing protein 4 [Takifugu flavidus]